MRKLSDLLFDDEARRRYDEQSIPPGPERCKEITVLFPGQDFTEIKCNCGKRWYLDGGNGTAVRAEIEAHKRAAGWPEEN